MRTSRLAIQKTRWRIAQYRRDIRAAWGVAFAWECPDVPMPTTPIFERRLRLKIRFPPMRANNRVYVYTRRFYGSSYIPRVWELLKMQKMETPWVAHWFSARCTR